VERVVDGTEMG